MTKVIGNKLVLDSAKLDGFYGQMQSTSPYGERKSNRVVEKMGPCE